jgi:serine/threonine protein kinase
VGGTSSYEIFVNVILQVLLPQLDKEQIDLLNRIFAYNPNKRPTAVEILQHPYFEELRDLKKFSKHKIIVPDLFDWTDGMI